jgi:hypothetical protein
VNHNPPTTHRWQLWICGTLHQALTGIHPRLASWDAKTHPSQRHLRPYLQDLMARLNSLPPAPLPLFLHLSVDVRERKNLLEGHDLENYLTPLFGREWLDSSRFVRVSATKRVGGGSRLAIGLAQGSAGAAARMGWGHFACAAGSGASEKPWKERLRAALARSSPKPLPPGPVEVHLAWRCSPARNWVNLWKPTGDAMGPVLGEAVRTGFHPHDDRIVSLCLHLNLDRWAGYDVDVGMWWRCASLERFT